MEQITKNIKENKNTKKIVIGVVIVIGILILFSVGSKAIKGYQLSHQPTATATATLAPTATSVPPTAIIPPEIKTMTEGMIHEELTLNDLSLTVMEAKVSVVDLSEKRSALILGVVVNLKNVGSTPLKYDYLSFRAQDDNRYIFTPTDLEIGNAEQKMGRGELKPGEEITKTVYFEVGKNSQKFMIFYYPLSIREQNVIKIRLFPPEVNG